MFRLSLKDIRIYWLTFLINFIFWSIMAPASIQSPDIYLMMPIGFGLLLVMIPLGNDTRDGRDILYVSLPIKRSRIVLARYLSSFFFAILAFAWMIIFGIVLERYMPGIAGGLSGRITPDNILIIAFLITLIICIYIPLVYRFGFGMIISGGLGVTILVIGGFWIGSSYLISSNSGLSEVPSKAGNDVLNLMGSSNIFYYLGKIIDHYGRITIIILILLIIIIIIIISATISIRIFSRKEF